MRTNKSWWRNFFTVNIHWDEFLRDLAAVTIIISNKFNFNNISEFYKIYIYSPSLHQDLYQNLIKNFGTYIPIHIIRNFLNVEDINIESDKVIHNKVFQKPDTEIETYESNEELKNPQDYHDWSIIILNDLNEKGTDGPRVQVMFKRSRRNIWSIFIISQDYHELPKPTIRVNGNIYHIFKPNIFRDVQSLN